MAKGDAKVELHGQRALFSAPHAAAYRSGSLPACLGLPSRPERRARAAWVPARGGGGALVPAQSRQFGRL